MTLIPGRPSCHVFLGRSFLSILLATNSAIAGVHVVDAANGPGTDFVDLTQAIAAAASFDTLLLRSGNYHDVYLDGKSLNFVADVGAVVSIGGPSPGTSSVRHLPPNGLVSFRGIRFENSSYYAGGGSFTTSAAMRLESNSGEIWFDECSDGKANPTLEIVDCERVVLTRCTFRPQDSHASALEIDDSSVAVFDSILEGAQGIPALPGTFGIGVKPAQPGGDAIVARANASLVLSHCTIRGGKGGNGYSALYCGNPANGGTGLVLKDTSPAPVVRVVATTFAGGDPGLPTGCGGIAIAGQPMLIGSGIVAEFAGSPMTLSATNPIRAGQSASLTFSNGTPGSSVLLLISNYPEASFVPALAGTLAVAAPFTIQSFGILSGPALTFTFTAPPMPGPLDEFHIFAQVGSCSANGECVLGNPTQIILLDASL